MNRAEMFAYDFMTNKILASRERRNRIGGTWAHSMPTTKPTWIFARFHWPLIYSIGNGPAHRRLLRSADKFAFDDEDRRGHAIDSVLAGDASRQPGEEFVIGRGTSMCMPERR